MFRHTKQLQFNAKPERPDALFAGKLQELVGGQFGEMTVMMQYLWQGWNCRVPGKYKDMILDIGTEEIGHVEMLCTMMARLLEGAPSETQAQAAAANPALAAVLGGQNVQHAIVSGGSAMPTNSQGVPWNAGYIVASGNLLADFRHNVAAEAQSTPSTPLGARRQVVVRGRAADGKSSGYVPGRCTGAPTDGRRAGQGLGVTAADGPLLQRARPGGEAARGGPVPGWSRHRRTEERGVELLSSHREVSHRAAARAGRARGVGAGSPAPAGPDGVSSPGTLVPGPAPTGSYVGRSTSRGPPAAPARPEGRPWRPSTWPGGSSASRPSTTSSSSR
ncbi:manganese catalase family protein (plasmid) [Georgenia sp. TF02-10]|uniref:manganese catalase family protein n=1 Tax=Georgenia sp. TF02-10 TaxID=2917725 RepID=UPI001FA6DBFB|nr:manganese catalase family protein [Georgenia sp. TF02-10]UNX56663.1 manganese catalase family protein [Georgenia sp. TF02-10]